MIKLLGLLGVKNEVISDGVVLNASEVRSTEAPYDLVKTHASLGLGFRAPFGKVWGSHRVPPWRVCYWNPVREPSPEGINGPWCGHSVGPWVYSSQGESFEGKSNTP